MKNNNKFNDLEELELADEEENKITGKLELTGKEKYNEEKLKDQYRNIIKIPYVKIWTKSYYSSPVPLLLIDNKLRIIWTNTQFNNLLEKIKNILVCILLIFIKIVLKKKKKNVYINI